ncbi:hypothetical protein Efla_000783 [Eimeria flavescens]
MSEEHWQPLLRIPDSSANKVEVDEFGPEVSRNCSNYQALTLMSRHQPAGEESAFLRQARPWVIEWAFTQSGLAA